MAYFITSAFNILQWLENIPKLQLSILVTITAILEQIYLLYLGFLDPEDGESKLFQNSSNY